MVLITRWSLRVAEPIMYHVHKYTNEQSHRFDYYIICKDTKHSILCFFFRFRFRFSFIFICSLFCMNRECKLVDQWIDGCRWSINNFDGFNIKKEKNKRKKKKIRSWHANTVDNNNNNRNSGFLCALLILQLVFFQVKSDIHKLCASWMPFDCQSKWILCNRKAENRNNRMTLLSHYRSRNMIFSAYYYLSSMLKAEMMKLKIEQLDTVQCTDNRYNLPFEMSKYWNIEYGKLV